MSLKCKKKSKSMPDAKVLAPQVLKFLGLKLDSFETTFDVEQGCWMESLCLEELSTSRPVTMVVLNMSASVPVFHRMKLRSKLHCHYEAFLEVLGKIDEFCVWDKLIDFIPSKKVENPFRGCKSLDEIALKADLLGMRKEERRNHEDFTAP